MLLDYVILSVLLVAGLVAVLTSWLWVPALVISSPVWVPSLLVLAAFLHITGLKTYVTGGAQAVYNWAFYKSNRPRRYLWNKFYNVLCRMFPEVEWKTMNYGYAALSETGHLTKL
ncbi:MAG: hypothetical protein V2I33_20830 [Kangiellaceae bacterium]|jgi:hypothetical protein|nr:hypothetical protein [Kangiellaceae bacterium]